MTVNEQLLQACVSFTQRLIQTKSMPKEEAEIAQLILQEMETLGYDEVWQDEMGNVFGRIYGQDRSLPALFLNTHLDHVDPGDPDLWAHPPYSGALVEGRIWGRGAVDIKGPLAVQVYSGAGLLREGKRPLRDLIVSAVVQEEIGGAGAIYWGERVEEELALIVIGEPSSNRVALGHRANYSFWVTFQGRSVHASVPERGLNPNYALATFLTRLQTAQKELSYHAILGQTTIAPTIIEVDTTSKNVTPAWTRVLLDCRTASESPASLHELILQLARGLKVTVREGWYDGEVSTSEETLTGFYTPPDDEAVIKAGELISAGMGRNVEFNNYKFATDGRHWTHLNVPMIGYAPGDEFLAHTAKESIKVDELAESLQGYIALVSEF